MQNLLACHDFQFIELVPDPANESCHASFRNASAGGSDTTASYVERDGSWHHLAVTWSTQDDGLTHIYWDGMLGACAMMPNKTKPRDLNESLFLLA